MYIESYFKFCCLRERYSAWMKIDTCQHIHSSFFIHNALTHTMLWQSEVLSNNLIKAMELITLYHVGGRIQIFLLSWLWNLSCLFGCFYGLLRIQCRWWNWNWKFCWCFKSLLFCQNLKYFFFVKIWCCKFNIVRGCVHKCV